MDGQTDIDECLDGWKYWWTVGQKDGWTGAVGYQISRDLGSKQNHSRCSLSVVDPRGWSEALVHRGHVEGTSVEMEYVEQVARGPEHSGSKDTKRQDCFTVSQGANLKQTKRVLPPDVSFVHDALEPVAELEERVDLKQTEERKLRIWTHLCFGRSDPTYPEEAVQSVHRGKPKVQTEEIERDDAEHICLKLKTSR